MNDIGKRIRAIRLASHLTLESVAHSCEMSVTGYGNIERGFTKDISILRLTKIAFVLKVNPLQLLISEDDNLIPKYLHDAVIEGYRLCNEQKEKEINYLKGLLDRSQFQYDK